MSLSLPRPPEKYDVNLARATNEAIESADGLNRKKRTHLEVSPPEQLILSSPDGTRWTLEVSNAGAAVFTALP